MKGLKKYSHKDREKVIQEIVPLIKKKFGENLLALAAAASYARMEDIDYSDLELVAFVYEMPGEKKVDGIGKIRDGLLVELVWMTKETYIERVREVTEDWYIAGSDVLLPLINEDIINELKVYKVESVREKCFIQAFNHWHEVQESTAKVLNAVKKRNRIGISLLVFDMYLHMLRVLSFLNQTPYKTFSEFVSQSLAFEIKPALFDELTHIMVEGTYQDFEHLEKVVTKVFSDFEKILEEEYHLYDDNIDPNLPKKIEKKN